MSELEAMCQSREGDGRTAKGLSVQFAGRPAEIERLRDRLWREVRPKVSGTLADAAEQLRLAVISLDDSAKCAMDYVARVHGRA